MSASDGTAVLTPVATQIALPSEDGDVAAFRRAVVAKLAYAVGKDPIVASNHDWFLATALTVRDRIVDRWFPSTRAIYTEKRKRVYYLSLEFLIGRLLRDSLNNLQLTDVVRAALKELGVDYDRLLEIEPDAALGNGGLGRLAACFMESMASLEVAAYGYGIRYDHGLFRQLINEGWQSEAPENWLASGNPWEFERPEVLYPSDETAARDWLARAPMWSPRLKVSSPRGCGARADQRRRVFTCRPRQPTTGVSKAWASTISSGRQR